MPRGEPDNKEVPRGEVDNKGVPRTIRKCLGAGQTMRKPLGVSRSIMKSLGVSQTTREFQRVRSILPRAPVLLLLLSRIRGICSIYPALGNGHKAEPVCGKNPYGDGWVHH